MSDHEDRFLDAFPEWLRQLAADARALADVVGDGALPEAVRRRCAAALNYLFKSVDLVPDGIEDLGFVDDAFVFRVAAAGALAASDATGAPPGVGALGRLGAEVELVREFVGDLFPRLQAYVDGLEGVCVRGRTAADVVADETVRAETLGELRAWAESYRAPSFARDPKNLVKLRAFLDVKLPA